jgi:hypothetical protein
VVRLDKTVAGSDTYNLGDRNYYDSGGDVYIHIERVGTGSWGAAVSANGMGWHPITAMQTQYFADMNRIKINLQGVGGGIFGWAPWGIDWVKVNHLFMFTRPL